MTEITVEIKTHVIGFPLARLIGYVMCKLGFSYEQAMKASSSVLFVRMQVGKGRATWRRLKAS